MIRPKTLLMACAVVMLCATFNSEKAFSIDITEGQTYDGYTDAGEFAGFYGGVAVNKNQLNVIKNTFSNNTNTHGAVYGIPGGGGAIYDWGGTLSIRDSIFDSNNSTATGTSTGGGALMLYQTKNAEVNNTEFNGNNAAQNGGAIYFAQSKQAKILNSKFNGNIAGNGGGAIYIQRAENIEISGSEFKGNKVGQINEYNKYGGAIMINGLSNSADSQITHAIHDCIF